MARTKGSKNRDKSAPAVPEPPVNEAVVKVASTQAVSNPGQKALLDQIAALQAENERLSGVVVKTQQEKDALVAAQAQGAIFGLAATEQFTGKQITVKRLKRYKVVGYENNKEVVRPEFHNVEVDTYMYKIDMPPCGDIALKINGIPFYHGAVYEVDVDTLRTLKDIVARTWDHDRSISSSNENFYRKKHEQFDPRNVLRGGG